MDPTGDEPRRTPSDQLRAADADRQRVADALQSAYAEGRLDLAEYDERVRQAWAARTYGDLARLTADLPAGPPAVRPADPAPAESRWQHPAGVPHRSHQRARRGAVLGWLGISLINVVIWLIVSVSTLDWVYPWWVWVAGPWGVVLLVSWLAERGGRAHPAP